MTTLVRNIPWGRAGTPADIGHAALFLASPEADFISSDTCDTSRSTVPAWP